MTLDPATLETWAAALLEASGLEHDAAIVAAAVYRRATLRGLGHHDLSYLPQRLGWLTSEKVNRRPSMQLVSATAAVEVWDGDGGLGEVLCSHITGRALELAARSGIGYAGIRRSNHFLAADPYVQRGAEAGFLVLVWSNTDAGMAFPGQHTRQIGNNPLGWGVGTHTSGLSADLCLAYSSLGNLTAMAQAQTPAPPHWGRGPDGQPTTQAQKLLEGAVEPIGGHKGLALALLGEVLTGVLTGGPTLDEIAPGGGLCTHNQMVLAFALDAFGGKTAIEERLVSLKERARAVSHADRLPGDRSRESEARALRDGVVVPAGLEGQLVEWSRKLGVRVPN